MKGIDDKVNFSVGGLDEAIEVCNEATGDEAETLNALFFVTTVFPAFYASLLLPLLRVYFVCNSNST